MRPRTPAELLAGMPGFEVPEPTRQAVLMQKMPRPVPLTELARQYATTTSTRPKRQRQGGRKAWPVVCRCGCGKRWEGGVAAAAKDLRVTVDQIKWRINRRGVAEVGTHRIAYVKPKEPRAA